MNIKDTSEPEIEMVKNSSGTFLCYKNDKVTKQLKAEGLEVRYPCISPEFIHPGDVCIDVGANIGTFSITTAKLVGSQGKIFAFEAFEKTYNLLAKNIEFNDAKEIVKPQKQVVSDSFKTYSSRATPNNMGATWFRQNTTTTAQEDAMLTSTTLDLWFEANSEIKTCNLIKIDVEGMEINVLKGATNLLTKHKPILFIEVCEAHYQRYGSSIKDLENFLKQQGYHFFRKFAPFPFRHSAFRRLFSLTQGSNFYDLLAIHPENSRYPHQYSTPAQAFVFMLGEKLVRFYGKLRSKYRLRTRIKNLFKKLN